MTIGQKILLGYGFAMALMITTGVAGYRSTQRLLDANGWVEHTFVVIGSAEGIGADLLQFENAGRGYLVTGEAKFLEPIDGIRSQLDQGRTKKPN